jgi:hypothetical protein
MNTTLANEALEKLWGRGDRATLKGSDRQPSLSLSENSFPKYFTLPSAGAKSDFHACLRDAERSGAITIEWDRRAGSDGQIKRLVLSSFAQLTAYLNRTSTQEVVNRAFAELIPWADDKRVAHLIDRWKNGKSPRGISSDRYADVVDALKVIDDRQGEAFLDESVRRVSARLFGDSKRIEKLVPIIDLLTATEGDSIARHPEAVLAFIGLKKYPIPFLVAGVGALILKDQSGGTTTAPVPYPYVGYEPRVIRGYVGSPSYVLSVENLTTFHELANNRAGKVDGLIVYTGGFPSPSGIKAYQFVTSEVPPGTPIYHWGDTDLSGFRIAVQLAEAIKPQSKRLLLWKMGENVTGTSSLNMTSADRERILQLCRNWKWDLAERNLSGGSPAIEQELQSLVLPA